MAEKKIKLEKNVISTQKAQSDLDGTFSEIILSPERIDDEKLKHIYESLFYKIPQRGKLSHEEIIIKSDNEVNPQTNINLEGEITILEQNLKEKNDKLNSLEAPENEHPIFSNNTFIQEGDPGQEVTVGNTIWYVQKGFKRIVVGSEYINLLRKINRDTLYAPNNLYIPLENSPLRQLAGADEINNILEAQDIEHGEDFSIEPVAKEHQNYLFDQLRVEFECFGRESYYAFSDEEKEGIEDFGFENNHTIPTDWVNGNGSNEPHGFWYLDKSGQCTLTYVNDVDPTIGFTPEETTLTLGVPGYIKRPISRDASIYSGDPFSAAYYEVPTNIQWRTRPPDTFNTAYPVMPYNKEWGPNGKFPSIINVSEGSRVKVKIMNKRDDGSPIYPREGSPDVEEWTPLYGIDEDHYADWVSLYGESRSIFGMWDRKSKYNTKMVNNMCYGPESVQNNCYGRLNQNWRRANDDINRRLMKLFADHDSRYYKKEHQYDSDLKGKVYGQPILLVDGKLMVYMGGYRSWGSDWNFFYNLENGGWNRVKNKNLEDEVLGYSRERITSWDALDAGDHKKYFQWINPDRNNNGTIRGKLNNPTLIYPGLGIHPLNGTDFFSNTGQDYTDLSGDSNFIQATVHGTGYSQLMIDNVNMFNPSYEAATGQQGSDFGMTQWMVDNLDFHNPFYAASPPGEEMFVINLNAS